MESFRKQLSRMPQHVQRSIAQTLKSIESGTPVRNLEGRFIKRANHRIFSIKVGTKYRVLCDYIDNQIQPRWAGSHSDYNKIINQF